MDNGSDRASSPANGGLAAAVLMVRMGQRRQLETTPENWKTQIQADRLSLEKLLVAVITLNASPSKPAWAGRPGLQLELALSRLARR
jgi:hypothetical protein